jgi:hypothetical protein
VRLLSTPLLGQQPCQAGCRPQFPRFRFLSLSDFDRSAKRTCSFVDFLPLLRALTFNALQLSIPRPLAGLLGEADSLRDRSGDRYLASRLIVT